MPVQLQRAMAAEAEAAREARAKVRFPFLLLIIGFLALLFVSFLLFHQTLIMANDGK